MELNAFLSLVTLTSADRDDWEGDSMALSLTRALPLTLVKRKGGFRSEGTAPLRLRLELRFACHSGIESKCFHFVTRSLVGGSSAERALMRLCALVDAPSPHEQL